MGRGAQLMAVLGVAWLASADSQQLARFEYSEPHMGTLMKIVLYADDETSARDASHAAFARIAALDETFSDYRDSSEVMRLSRASGGAPVKVSDDLFRVLRASQALARASDGAFDVTAGPLTILWRYARRHSEVPSADRLDAARALVGDARMELDDANHTVWLRVPGMQIDLGGIAKGFAADEAALVLTRSGISRALVAAGGDIVATDAPPGQDGWRVAVSSLPPAPAGPVTLRNAAVSTSGDAEQFFEANGVRYSHIIDPRTGHALEGRSSVTVIAPNGTTSDSLATAVSVMSPESGLLLVEATSGTAARITLMDKDGRAQVFRSARWQER